MAKGLDSDLQARINSRAVNPTIDTTAEVVPETALAVKGPNALEHVPAPMTPAQGKVEAIAALTMSAYSKAGTLDLTPEETAELQGDFPDEAFLPGAAGKEHLLYLQHAHLRERLTKVFGMGQWAIVPRNRWSQDFTTAKGKKGSKVYVEAMLVIRGCFAGEAVGDMDYYHDNDAGNYGDAVEGAKSAALRRCAKELGVGLQAWKKEWGDGWWQRKRGAQRPQNRPETNAPPVTGASQPQNAPKASPAPMAGVKAPNGDAVKPEFHAKVLRGNASEFTTVQNGDATKFGKRCREKWIAAMDSMGTNARAVAWAFAQECAWIHPGEDLEDCPVDKVPLTAKEFVNIVAEVKTRLTDHNAVEAAYDAYMATKQPSAGEPPAEVKKAIEAGTQVPRKPKDPEYWREVIIPVPRKSMKKAEYDKNPDTIGSLYDKRHGNDDEAAIARQRLFGLIQNWKANGWTNGRGKHYPPSAADTKCRLALDDFWEYFEREHPGEKL